MNVYILYLLINISWCYLFSFSLGGLWSVFTLGGAGNSAGIDQDNNLLPLSNQSLLLLLVLANLTDGPDWPNPFRQAITCFRNTQGNNCTKDKIFAMFCCIASKLLCTVWLVPDGNKTVLVVMLTIFTLPPVDTSLLPVEPPHTFQINFNSLYTALCEQQRSDQATLLLYTLLHQNANMRTYILSRTDMDNLVGGGRSYKVPLILSIFQQLDIFRKVEGTAVVKNQF